MIRSRLRLGQVFFLWMAGLLVLVLIVSSAVVVWHDQQALENDLRREGQFLATALAAFLAPDVPAQRRTELERRFLQLTPHLVAAEARDVRGGGITWRFGPPARQAAVAVGPTLEVVERVARPHGGGEIEVHVVLSRREMNAVLTRGVARLVVTLTGVLMLMLLIGSAQVRELVLPLEKMADRARGLRPGDTFEAPSRRTRVRELDDLAEALHGMSDRLRIAREALAGSEERYRELVNASPTPLVSVDRTLAVTDANPAGRELLGSCGDLCDVLDTSDGERLVAAVESPSDRGLERVELTWRGTDDEMPRSMDVFVQPLLGTPKRWLLGLHDVSERVRHHGLRWQRTFDAMVDGVAVVDEHGTIVLANRALEAVRDRVEQELGARTGAPDLREDMWRFRQAGRTYDLRLTPGGDAGSKVLVARDVTQVVAAEERMSQIEKMEIVAALSSGVAHDFNNLFTAILLHVRLIEKDPGEVPEAAEAILQLAENGAELVSELVQFAGDDPTPATALNLARWLGEQRSFLGHLVPDHVQLRLEAGQGRLVVAAREMQLRRALLNLVLNAVQAIGSREGSITVGVAGRPDDQVELLVRDTGPGFPDDMADRVVHPFERPRSAGHGIGLGLAVVIAAARSHGGEVLIRRPAGGGAEVVLLLPVAVETGFLRYDVPE